MYDKYLEGATIIVKTCAGLMNKERLCVVFDDSTRKVADIIAAAAGSVTDGIKMASVPEAKVHGQEPPASAARAMANSDVIIAVTRGSLAHTKARKAASLNGARYISLAGYTMSQLASPSLRVDFKAEIPLVKKIKSVLDAGTTVRVTSKLGTAVTLDIKGRRANACPGICIRQGEINSPPDIEVNIAPREGRSGGTIVVDGSITCAEIGLLARPVRLDIKDGRIIGISGSSKQAGLFKRALAGRDFRASVLAEFGVGLNPRARICGRMLEDEGARGSVHFGFGSNATIGGKNDTNFHVDCVIRKPSVIVGKRKIISNGMFII